MYPASSNPVILTTQHGRGPKGSKIGVAKIPRYHPLCYTGGLELFILCNTGHPFVVQAQSTPDNSNLQGKLNKVRVIGSLKQNNRK